MEILSEFEFIKQGSRSQSTIRKRQAKRKYALLESSSVPNLIAKQLILSPERRRREREKQARQTRNLNAQKGSVENRAVRDTQVY